VGEIRLDHLPPPPAFYHRERKKTSDFYHQVLHTPARFIARKARIWRSARPADGKRYGYARHHPAGYIHVPRPVAPSGVTTSQRTPISTSSPGVRPGLADSWCWQEGFLSNRGKNFDSSSRSHALDLSTIAPAHRASPMITPAEGRLQCQRSRRSAPTAHKNINDKYFSFE